MLIFGIVISANAQIGVTALVKTTFTDVRTGQPLALKYELIPESGGAKIRGNTPSNGTFEQILKPGETYKVNCTMAEGIVAPLTFTLRASNKYYEESQTLALKILKKGDVLGEWSLFTPAKHVLNSENELAGISDMIAMNRGLYVTLSVADDPEVKPTGKAAKKPKPTKKSKAPAIPTIDIVAERISAINAYFAQKLKPEALKRLIVKLDIPRTGVNVWASVSDIKSFE